MRKTKHRVYFMGGTGPGGRLVSVSRVDNLTVVLRVNKRMCESLGK